MIQSRVWTFLLVIALIGCASRPQKTDIYAFIAPSYELIAQNQASLNELGFYQIMKDQERTAGLPSNAREIIEKIKDFRGANQLLIIEIDSVKRSIAHFSAENTGLDLLPSLFIDHYFSNLEARLEKHFQTYILKGFPESIPDGYKDEAIYEIFPSSQISFPREDNLLALEKQLSHVRSSELEVILDRVVQNLLIWEFQVIKNNASLKFYRPDRIALGVHPRVVEKQEWMNKGDYYEAEAFLEMPLFPPTDLSLYREECWYPGWPLQYKLEIHTQKKGSKTKGFTWKKRTTPDSLFLEKKINYTVLSKD